MQCKFYWQIGKQFFNLLIDFFMHIFQLNFCFVFWLTHELKFGSFQASFLLTKCISHLEILWFCLYFFHVFLWFFFSLFLFLLVVLSSFGKFWISDSSEADSISDLIFDWILIRFTKIIYDWFWFGFSIRYCRQIWLFCWVQWWV